jgi:5-methylcytosine-specific restriction endonuclease McrA
LLVQALNAPREALYRRAPSEPEVSAETPTMAQQQADALALIAETALHHGIDPGTPGVSAETSQRLACDASRVVMRHDADGRPVEIGARTRTIPPALRRALHHRDRGCRFPGCGLPFGQGHHIRHWARGGPTTLSNLAMLCRRHHRAVHEEGFQVDRQTDGELRFRRPDGRELPDVPSPLQLRGDAAKVLRARNEAEGLAAHAHTATPGWLGVRLDVGYATSCIR